MTSLVEITLQILGNIFTEIQKYSQPDPKLVQRCQHLEDRVKFLEQMLLHPSNKI